VGWIDDARYDFYCADGDLSLKIWYAGYEIAACSDALLEHFEHVDPKMRGQNLSRLNNDWTSYLDRWTGIFYDPAAPSIGEWITLGNVSVRDATHLFPKRAANRSRRFVPQPSSIVRRLGKLFTR
jgi:GT2 family glycosyltransferase